jgi:mutator protein MutT
MGAAKKIRWGKYASPTTGFNIGGASSGPNRKSLPLQGFMTADSSLQTPPTLLAALALPWVRTPTGVQVLVARRRPGRRFAGLWEWPGGKIEPGESPAQAAVRELQEETGITAEVSACTSLCVHRDPGPPAIDVHVFLLPVQACVKPRASAASEPLWMPLKQALGLPFPPANQAINTLIPAALRG